MSAAKPRLAATDWTDAALAAMAEQGTAGVNVEQLARSLGATKGSFYHHFENREALLTAALERWEAMVADDFTAADTITDPRRRLETVTLVAIGSEINGFVDVALGASADDPHVAATLRRVNQLRLAYVERVLRELGVPPELSRRRAIGGLSTYLGLYQLQRVTGERFDETQVRRFVDDAIAAMLAGTDDQDDAAQAEHVHTTRDQARRTTVTPPNDAQGSSMQAPLA